MTEADLIIKRINGLLEIKNMTQYQLANAAGIHTSTLSKILRNENANIKINTISKICKGFNISKREFYNHDLFN